ncbi:uncharacterized protein LOC123682589 isoform X3 [Harmonia axyridis]|uniref:uncharacterized protein LOC123682589 isoform X3 n=1 Tax=Harmonia axyridis TaxID=115357 RepID=UPI001E276395|nr:uncharacterized protein LOC123682589 isoform X3 [Harmonia axyridis]
MACFENNIQIPSAVFTYNRSKASYCRQFFHLGRQRHPESHHSNSMTRIDGESERCHDSRISRGRGTPTNRIGGESARSHNSHHRGRGTFVPRNYNRDIPPAIRPRSPMDEPSYRRTHAEHSFHYGPNSHRRRVETEFQEREFRRSYHNERFLAYPRRDPEPQIHRKSRQRPPFLQDRKVLRNLRTAESECGKNVSSQPTSSSDSNHKAENRDKETESKKSEGSDSSGVSMDLGTDEEEENLLKEMGSNNLDSTNSQEQSSNSKSDEPKPDSTPSKINKDVNPTTSTSSSSSSISNNTTLTNSLPVPPKQTDTVQTSDLIKPTTTGKDPRLQKRSRSSEVYPDNKNSDQNENITTKLVDPRRQPMGTMSRSVPLELKLPQFCKTKLSLECNNKKVSFKKPANHIAPKISKKGGHINDKKLVCIKNRVELKKYNKPDLEKYCCHVRIQKEHNSFQELSELSIESLIDTRKSYLESKKEDEQPAESKIDASTQGRQHTKENKTSTVEGEVRKHVKSSSTKVNSKHRIVAGKDKVDQLHTIKETKENIGKQKDKVASVSSKSSSERHSSTGLKRKISESPSDGTATKKNIHKEKSSSVGKVNPKRPRLMENKDKFCKKLVKSTATKDKKIDKNTSHNTITYIVQSTVSHSTSNHSTIACTSIVPKGKSLPMIVDDDSEYNITEENCVPPIPERSSTPCLDERDDTAEKEYSLHIPEGSIDSSDSLIKALDETIEDINVSISSLSKMKQKDTGTEKQTSSLIHEDYSPRPGVLECSSESAALPNESIIPTQETIDKQNSEDCPANIRSESIISSPKNNEVQLHQKGNATDKQNIEDCSSQSLNIHSESMTYPSNQNQKNNATHEQTRADCSTGSSDIQDESIISSLDDQNISAELLMKGNATDEQTSANSSVESVLIHNDLIISSPINQENVVELHQKDNERSSEPLGISHESSNSSPKDQKVVEGCQKAKSTIGKTSAVCTVEPVGISTQFISPEDENNAAELFQKSNETDELSACSEEYLGVSQESINSSPKNNSGLHNDEQINAQDDNCEFDSPQSEGNRNIDDDIFSREVSELLGNDEDEILLDVRVIENPEIKKEADEVACDFHFDMLQGHIEVKTEVNDEALRDVQSLERTDSVTNEPVVNTKTTTPAEISVIPSLEPQTVDKTVDINVEETLNNIEELKKMLSKNSTIERKDNSSIGPQSYGCSMNPSGDGSETPNVMIPTVIQMSPNSEAIQSNEPEATVVTNQSNVSTINPISPNDSGVSANQQKSSESNDMTKETSVVPEIEKHPTLTCPVVSGDPVNSCPNAGCSFMPTRRLLPQMYNLSNARDRKSQREINHSFLDYAFNLMKEYMLMEKSYCDTGDKLKSLNKYYNVEVDICNLNYTIRRTKMIYGDMLLCSLRTLRLHPQRIDAFVLYFMEYLKRLIVDVEKKPLMTIYLLDLIMVHQEEYEKCEFLRNFKQNVENEYYTEQNLGYMTMSQYGVLKSQICHYIRILQNNRQIENKQKASRSTETAIKNPPPPNVCIFNESNAVRTAVGMRNNQYSAMKNNQNSAMTNIQPSAMRNSQHSPTINSQHIAMTNSQHSAMTNSQHSAMTNSQHSAMKNSQYSAMTNSQHSSMRNSQNSPMTNSQHIATTNSQYSAMTNSQHSAMRKSQNSPMTNSQHSSTTNSQHIATTNSQHSAITNSQHSALKNSQYSVMTNSQHSAMTKDMNQHAMNTVSNSRVSRPNSGSNDNTMNKPQNITNVCRTLQKSTSNTSGGSSMVRGNLRRSISNPQASYGNMTVPQPYLQTQLLYAPNVMSYQGQSVLGIQSHSLGQNAQTGDVNVTISTQLNPNYSGYQSHSIPSQSAVLKRANSQDKNRDEPEGKRRKPTPTFRIIEKNKITVNPNARNTPNILQNILQNTSSTLQIINKNGVYESHTLNAGFGSAAVQNVVSNSVTCCVTQPTASSGGVCFSVIPNTTVVGNQDVSSAKSRPPPPAYNVDMRQPRPAIYTPDNRCCSPSTHKNDSQHSRPPTTNPDIRTTPPVTNSDIPYHTPPEPEHIVIPYPTPPESERIPNPTPPMSFAVNPNDMSLQSNPEPPSENVELKQSRPSTPSEETETKPFVSPITMNFPSEIIDLTYFDDEPIIKEEPSEECESAQSQDEIRSEGVLILENRVCVCGKVAEYLCACSTVMYCSTECQLKDWWPNHQRVCSSVIVMTSGE